MKKITWSRLGLGFLQNFMAACILMTVAFILFYSHVSVKSMDGTKTYNVDPFDTEPVFESTEMFNDIFGNAVSDIIRLVAIRDELETDYKLDLHKKIDITEYARRRGYDEPGDVTAVYELDDLIKWGKAGVEYYNRVMSMSEFVDYFGDVTGPEHFELDDAEQLYFAGFEGRSEALPEEEEQKLALVMEDYSKEQLKDMVYSYIVGQLADEINMSREDDGTLTVYVNMINCRYNNVNGVRQLVQMTDNWVDYIRLQNNLAKTIAELSEHYTLYQNFNQVYSRGNLHYAVRVGSGKDKKIFTNDSKLAGADESQFDDYFANYRKYLIYYQDDLQYVSNTELTEQDMFDLLEKNKYAYPESTNIWTAVDTDYEFKGDALSYASEIFQRLVPRMGFLLIAIAIMTLIWTILGFYLTVTDGVYYNEQDERLHYTYGIDHIWLEVMLLFGAATVYFGRIWWRWLSVIADNVYMDYNKTTFRVYEYGSFGAYGFLMSLIFMLMWYSLIRRVRTGIFLRTTMVSALFRAVGRLTGFVFRHRSIAISTVIPYNLFLLINAVGIYLAITLDTGGIYSALIVIGLVALDSLVGIYLFRLIAEQRDIVEGIGNIRDGQVDYKLETENLTLFNREMADAVNNIGEGIRKAVDTSMKDEQMKTDLITNVSHDIKTPLTSIINYVDLLKRLHIEDEPAKGYIEVLDSKAQRLKQLTDDLVEASKISSGNIVLNKEKLNLTELLNQAIGEFSEKFEELGLQAIVTTHGDPAYICADSRRMWRVVENLFNNICKYALENTRVYVDVLNDDGRIDASVKNISRRQMNIQADELTERFIRGDSSRTTEGSGLGLSIAKSLVQMQGGIFDLYVDGDLFKVTMSFDEYLEPEAEELEAEDNEAVEETMADTDAASAIADVQSIAEDSEAVLQKAANSEGLSKNMENGDGKSAAYPEKSAADAGAAADSEKTAKKSDAETK